MEDYQEEEAQFFFQYQLEKTENGNEFYRAKLFNGNSKIFDEHYTREFLLSRGILIDIDEEDGFGLIEDEENVFGLMHYYFSNSTAEIREMALEYFPEYRQYVRRKKIETVLGE